MQIKEFLDSVCEQIKYKPIREDIAEELNTTANMVGRIANKLGLKAKQPGHNKYGRWANSKSKYSDKEVPQWLYTNEEMKAVKKELEK